MINLNFFEHFPVRESFPRAYTDFLDFYSHANTSIPGMTDIEQLTFPFQAGWLLSYFNQNAVSIDLMDLSLENLLEIFPDCFKNMEHILSHYS